MEDVLFNWEVELRNGKTIRVDIPETEAFEAKWWLIRELGVSQRSLKRTFREQWEKVID